MELGIKKPKRGRRRRSATALQRSILKFHLYLDGSTAHRLYPLKRQNDYEGDIFNWIAFYPDLRGPRSKLQHRLVHDRWRRWHEHQRSIHRFRNDWTARCRADDWWQLYSGWRFLGDYWGDPNSRGPIVARGAYGDQHGSGCLAQSFKWFWSPTEWGAGHTRLVACYEFCFGRRFREPGDHRPACWQPVLPAQPSLKSAGVITRRRSGFGRRMLPRTFPVAPRFVRGAFRWPGFLRSPFVAWPGGC